MAPQTRINATISYFFLGWLMLLSKNVEWNDSFVRAHARMATMIHIAGLVISLIYRFAVADLVVFTLPIIHISLYTAIATLFFIFFLSLLLWFAYRAYHGLDPTYHIGSFSLSLASVESLHTELSETEKMIILGSYLPFLGVILRYRYPNEYTEYGVKIGGFLTLLLILSVIMGGSTGNGVLIFSFIYIAVCVTVGVWLFLQGTIFILSFLQKFPTIDRALTFVRAGVSYFFAFLPIAFGREKTLAFSSFLSEEEKALPKQESFFLSPALIGIPFLNLIFLPMLLMGKNPEWRHAILQGIILDILILIIGFSRGFSSSWMLLLLIPIFRMIAMFPLDARARIPFLYEIFLTFNALTFGFLDAKKSMNEKNETVEYEYERQKSLQEASPTLQK